MQETAHIAVMLVIAALFFILAVIALYWSVKSGQWRQLQETSISIFNDEEPEGVQSDFFPGKKTSNLKGSKNK